MKYDNQKVPMHKIKIGFVPFKDMFETEQDWQLYREIFAIQHGLPYTPPPPSPTPDPPAHKSKAGILWLPEAIAYLGLDRIGLKRPDKAIHRLINKGALHPKKISGRLCFDRSELDTIITNGDQKRGRGRPRK